MGFHGISMGSLLLILIISVVVFGTKRLRNLGEDLGAAVRGFQKGMQQENQADENKPPHQTSITKDETST